VVTDRGKARVEIEGDEYPLTGQLGAKDKSNGRNYVSVYSEGGDVQLSQLTSLF
jgi:hypothetical protein